MGIAHQRDRTGSRRLLHRVLIVKTDRPPTDLYDQLFICSTKMEAQQTQRTQALAVMISALVSHRRHRRQRTERRWWVKPWIMRRFEQVSFLSLCTGTIYLCTILHCNHEVTVGQIKMYINGGCVLESGFNTD